MSKSFKKTWSLKFTHVHTGLLVNNLVWVRWDSPVWCAHSVASLATHTEKTCHWGCGESLGTEERVNRRAK